MNRPTHRSPGAVLLRAIAIWVLAASPSLANFLTLSPTGPAGSAGSITFAEIGVTDPTSANVNTDFTAPGSIAVTFTVSDNTPVSLYGTAVNDSLQAWTGFSAQVISGAASFQNLNDPFNPYGTYTDTQGWTVALGLNGSVASFSGSSLNPGSSLDLFLGLVVSDPTQSVTIELTPSSAATVPEPSSLLLGAIAAATLGLGRLRRPRSVMALLAVGVGIAAGSNAQAAGPVVAPAYQANFTVAAVGTVAGLPAQMVFGPDGRLYVMTPNAGPISYAYNKGTGALTSPIMAAPSVKGLGIGFHGADLYLSTQAGTIHKLRDANGNGVYGEANELDVAIVTGLPQGDHNTDQIQIRGDTLYVGIGRRTINGRFGAWTSGSLDDITGIDGIPGGSGFFYGGKGRTFGDSAYNGTISWIQNLNAVVEQTGSANAWTTEPPVLTQALIQHDSGPFTALGQGKLVVHSAGTRNPFGLCLDKNGALWFTNNYNRAQTLGNGQTPFGLRGDQLNSDFSIDIYDQLFQASTGADYGYADSNWRNVNPMMTPSAPGYHLVRSTTFDNSYNKGPYTIHDPANPDGCGPSASADGCAFAYNPKLPADLVGNIFIARFNGTIKEAPGGAQRSLTYNDLIAVNPTSGKVRRVASGFNGPLAVLSDDANGRLLIGNANDGMVYSLQSTGQ